ncbi:helix-turn-helix transcriptional regulator [Faecalicatena contorta]|uniref:DNA-binding transcriptional regulator, XRE-family HTH domain n=1 Tax=Faecalicatena contorta TaxID=39482 RepID=A0A315ZUI2_9FIRM|nr:helix-turn-helix transcriptional regulator [Faecalicatena contorta]PWJ49155.1 DNA-binding XRE family transcriptional regulator [Faecalicatena contorta]SUQ14860.1 DNA-binding transcriptional regulator, XRE-family HTH domain [Faecalicatena contorta]
MDVTKKSIRNTTKTTNVSYTAKSFGRKLIELRNEKDITQADSAELIGITRNTLSMYERNERCPNIDIAVNAANAYNVSLDYLFGIGYREKKKNHESLYDYFSEESLDFLSDTHIRYFVDSMLSHPNSKKISDILYAIQYKPLINSYEINYISRLISDLLYSMVVDINKDAYELRPMLENELSELLEAVNDCISKIEQRERLLRTDYDKYLDCEDSINTELERIKSLLENAPDTEYNQAREAGFTSAIKMIANGEMGVPSLISPEDDIIKEMNLLTPYLNKIPLKKRINMSIEEEFKTAREIMEKEQKK